MLSNKRICEGDSDVSSDEEVNDKITTTQRHEDSGEHNSIDGAIEESQAWFFEGSHYNNMFKDNINATIFLLLPKTRILGVANSDIHV